MSLEDEELRRAWASRPIEASVGEDDALADELWDVATGTLEGPEAQALVDRCTHDPELAELWRVTFALARESGQALDSEAVLRLETATSEPGPAEPERRGSIVWLGVAVLAAAAAVLLVVRPAPPPGPEVEPVMRAEQPTALEAVTADGAVLPRDAFVLRWTGAPAHSHYELRVETEQLESIVVEPDLDAPSFRVEPSSLRGLESGTVLHWRVTAITPEGWRLESPGYRVSVQ